MGNLHLEAVQRQSKGIEGPTYLLKTMQGGGSGLLLQGPSRGNNERGEGLCASGPGGRIAQLSNPKSPKKLQTKVSDRLRPKTRKEKKNPRKGLLGDTQTRAKS